MNFFMAPWLSGFLFLIFMSSLRANAKLMVWKNAPRGVNMSSANSNDDIKAAKQYGIRLIRLGATGSPGDFRFLVKDIAPDDAWDLSHSNLRKLRDLADKLDKQGINVVFTLAHIPGRAWEHRKRDFRIWRNERFQREFCEAWKKIAKELAGLKNVVGYDLLNEPYLSRDNGQADDSKDLWNLYTRLIEEIRTVDAKTPIIVESPEMASVYGFSKMPAMLDKNIIYSFHYYEPFPYFSPPLNKGKLSYPGMMPAIEQGPLVLWNKATHLGKLEVVRNWQIQNGIESFRIYVGEFGSWRKALGADRYLDDVTDIFEMFGWSWSYYAFRENDWDVADLELDGASMTRTETNLFKVLKNKFR